MMNKASQARPKNYRRRTIGILLSLVPAVLALASLAVGLAGWFSPSERAAFAGLGCVYAAVFFTAINFYCTVIRPLLFRLWNGSSDRYHGPSVFPLFGDILVVLSSLLSFGTVGTAAIALCVVATDTGGSPYFILATWRDSGVWDSP